MRRVAIDTRIARPRSTAPDRMDHQATKGSRRTLARNGWTNFIFSFHDREEIGPRMLARIAKRTGLEPDDL